MAAMLAFDAKYTLGVSIQVQHPGLGTLLLAQCNPAEGDTLQPSSNGGLLRAYANPQAQNTAFDLMAKTPGGYVIVTMEPTNFEQRYQSVIPLEGTSAADCMATYFKQSVQTPTLIKVLSNLDAENGTLEDDDWTRMGLLLKTLTTEEAVNPELTPEKLLTNLFAEDDLTLYEPCNPQFANDDPRPRMLAALAAMPKAELAELIQMGKITLTDQTTGNTVTFTAEELAHLQAEPTEKTH
jgi:molecular chaperone Hsp33